jgi:hypothetical protein
MGYLNGDTIVVDAILTKHGRRILSEPGGNLSISHFALSDDGIDYSLWDTASLSGSTGYGNTITMTPQIEAVPDDSAMMRYKLLTLNPNTEYMPVITLDPTTYSLTNTTVTANITPSISNYNDETGFNWRIPDTSAIIIDGHDGTIVDLAGTAIEYPTQTEIPNYIEIINSSFLRIKAQSGLTAQKQVHMTIEGFMSGAITTTTVTVSANV